MEIIHQNYKANYLNYQIAVTLAADKTWRYTVYAADWSQLVQKTGLGSDSQAWQEAKSDVDKIVSQFQAVSLKPIES